MTPAAPGSCFWSQWGQPGGLQALLLGVLSVGEVHSHALPLAGALRDGESVPGTDGTGRSCLRVSPQPRTWLPQLRSRSQR